MGSHYNGVHLGLAYISAVANNNGHECKIFNADYENKPEYLTQNQLFENTNLYKEILNDLSHPIWQEIRSKIEGYKPDFVGITMMTANYKSAIIIADIAHELGCRTVVGGVHPTLADINDQTSFDYIIQHEGEFGLLQLPKEFTERRVGSYSFIKHLDGIPFPDRESYLNPTEYMDYGNIITGRGCPYSCSYCASPALWNHRTRYRSVDNVIEELTLMKKKWNPVIHFVDDTFTLDKQRVTDICRRMLGMGLKWVCDTRADCLDRELVALMKLSGCVRIKLGVESGSEKILKSIHKRVDKDKIRESVSLIKRKHIPLTIYLMAGFPDETDEDLQQTIDFANELEANYNSLSILAPYYGTEIWNQMKPDKEHWEYFYHQNKETINKNLSPRMIDKFLALGEGKRV
jgi:radical SAM superfamily enzyme YgiQ (UPF0313 family)